MNIVGDFCEETVMAMGLPLAAWRGPCKSKDEGGLGFRSMSLIHETLLGKQLAKYLDKPSLLWARVIQHKYKLPRDVWRLQPLRVESQAWSAVVSEVVKF